MPRGPPGEPFKRSKDASATQPRFFIDFGSIWGVILAIFGRVRHDILMVLSSILKAWKLHRFYLRQTEQPPLEVHT